MAKGLKIHHYSQMAENEAESGLPSANCSKSLILQGSRWQKFCHLPSALAICHLVDARHLWFAICHLRSGAGSDHPESSSW
jgi:hypothetical protein